MRERIKVGSFWRNKDDGMGHVIKGIEWRKGMFGGGLDIVTTLTEAGNEYTHSLSSLEKYYEEVDDV